MARGSFWESAAAFSYVQFRAHRIMHFGSRFGSRFGSAESVLCADGNFVAILSHVAVLSGHFRLCRGRNICHVFFASQPSRRAMPRIMAKDCAESADGQTMPPGSAPIDDKAVNTGAQHKSTVNDQKSTKMEKKIFFNRINLKL